MTRLAAGGDPTDLAGAAQIEAEARGRARVEAREEELEAQDQLALGGQVLHHAPLQRWKVGRDPLWSAGEVHRAAATAADSQEASACFSSARESCISASPSNTSARQRKGPGEVTAGGGIRTRRCEGAQS